jgi:hypothetical protein
VARQIIVDVLDDAVIVGRISSHRIKSIGLRVYEQVNRYSTGTMALKHRKLGRYSDIPVPG